LIFWDGSRALPQYDCKNCYSSANADPERQTGTSLCAGLNERGGRAWFIESCATRCDAQAEQATLKRLAGDVDAAVRNTDGCRGADGLAPLRLACLEFGVGYVDQNGKEVFRRFVSPDHFSGHLNGT